MEINIKNLKDSDRLIPLPKVTALETIPIHQQIMREAYIPKGGSGILFVSIRAIIFLSVQRDRFDLNNHQRHEKKETHQNIFNSMLSESQAHPKMQADKQIIPKADCFNFYTIFINKAKHQLYFIKSMSYNIHKLMQPRRGISTLPQLSKPAEQRNDSPHPYSDHHFAASNSNQLIIEAISKLMASNQETMRQMMESFKNDKGSRNIEKVSENGLGPYMESRFTHIDLQVPKLPSSNKRRRLISIWLGKLVPKVLSFCFNAFEKGNMNETQTKVHCSEMLILAIIRLIKENDLSEEEVKFVDEQCLKKILDYNAAKYPQSSQVEKNKDIEGIITERDDIGDPTNDFIAKSGIEFKLKESGNYNSEIMRFFNYLIGLMEDKKYENKDLKKVLSEIGLHSEDDKNEADRQNISSLKRRDQHQQLQKKQGKNKQSTTEKETLTKQFQQDIRTLFTIAEDEDKVTQLSVKPTEWWMENKGITERIGNHSNKSTNNIQENAKLLQQERQKLKYQEEVRTYTSSAVGSKFSSNTPLFTSTEIENGDLTLSNPTLFRVATKWVEELEGYFKEKSIMGREYPYRMRKGEDYLVSKESHVLHQLLQCLKKAEGGPDACLREIVSNTKSCERIFAKQECEEELLQYTQEQAVVGKFALTLHKNSQTYLIKYLNCLIHTLLKAAEVKRIFKVLRTKTTDIITDEDIEDNIQEYNCLDKDGGIETQNLDTTPILVTFTIGDLLRCKLSSRDKEIKAIYKLLDLVSKRNPEIINLVRVKNRLSTGNRDILINLTYRRTLLVEVQLATKTNKSHFIERSNAFNHFIYELKRAKFGPVTELCSIWAAKDPRADFYRSHIAERTKLQGDREWKIKKEDMKEEKSNTMKQRIEEQKSKGNEGNDQIPEDQSEIPGKIKSEEGNLQSACQHPSEQRTAISLPYVCSQCSHYFSNMFYRSMHCKNCQQSLCFDCQKNSLQQKEKIVKQYVKNEDFNAFDTKSLKEGLNMKQNNISLQKAYEILPEHCYLINIKSSNRLLRQVYKIVRDNKIYYLTREEKIGKIRYDEVEKIDNKQQLTEFLICNIIADSDRKQGIPISEIKSQIQTLHFLPKQMIAWTKKQKESITIVNEQLTNQSIQRVLQSTDRKWHSLKKLNLSENNLTNIDTIVKMEPRNLQSLILSYNYEIISLIEDRQLNLNVLFNLRNLQMKSCKNLRELPTQIEHLKQITDINLSKCLNLYSLSESFTKLNSLKNLDLSECTSLETIPNDFGDLSSLIKLDLFDCKGLCSLPESFAKLKSLKNLKLTKCQSLVNLPDNFGELRTLETLDISMCSIGSLPQSFGKLQSLKDLYLDFCMVLSSLPDNFGDLQALEKLSLYYCTNLSSLPEYFGRLKSLKSLVLSQCKNLPYLPTTFGMLKQLKNLELDCCSSLLCLPDDIGNLESLQKLSIYKCKKLNLLPKSFAGLKCLKNLNLSECVSLQSLPDMFSNLSSLQTLELASCSNLQSLPESFGGLKSLKELNLYECQFESLPDSLGDLLALEKLELSQCKKLQTLPASFCELESLKELNLENCFCLKSLPDNFSMLRSLDSLVITGYSLLNFIPLSMNQLQKVRIKFPDFYCNQEIYLRKRTFNLNNKCKNCLTLLNFPIHATATLIESLCHSCYCHEIEKEPFGQIFSQYPVVVLSGSPVYPVYSDQELIYSPPTELWKEISKTCSACKLQIPDEEARNVCIGCSFFRKSEECVVCQACMEKVMAKNEKISQHLTSLHSNHQSGHNWAKANLPSGQEN